MDSCDCLDEGSRLVECVGLLFTIREDLLVFAYRFDPVTWELQRWSFNASLAAVTALWEKLKIVMQEAHGAIFVPLASWGGTLAQIRPI